MGRGFLEARSIGLEEYEAPDDPLEVIHVLWFFPDS